MRKLVKSIHTGITVAAPWGIVLAAGSLLTTCTGLMIALEDRQSERIFRAWEVVISAVESAREPNRISDSIKIPNDSERSRLHARGSAVRQAIEYLNRSFPGRWCASEIIKPVSIHFTGHFQRECVFPKKRRESFYGLSLFYMNLSSADLRNADLRSTDLRDANLRNATLWGADLRGADLREVDLEYATLWSAILQGANLRNANLRGASLLHADLREAEGISCRQLTQAKNWTKSYRDKSLACGETIPNSPHSDTAG